MLFREFGVTIRSQSTYPTILDPGAIEFLAELFREYSPRLAGLLKAREERQAEFDAGGHPGFFSETKDVRDSSWKVAELPTRLADRRVEITGPPDRKMTINALNSGASVFMADFEDSLSPTWRNVVDGQKNLIDANRLTITFEHPTKGTYSLNEDHAILFVRPRGLHLVERHFEVDGESIPASLFDFGLYLYHNGKYLVEQGLEPCFYLPKLEHYLEARWWNDVFVWSQDKLGIPQGSIRATVLLETLPAAFQMNEILYELRDHSAGLNCGRWDYIFSYIKTFRNHPDRVTPDRALIGMTSPFMDAYSKAVIQTCHRRGAHAMGGMAAQIPIKDNPSENKIALDKVYQDKRREALAGHDGTWVAHPGLVSLAKEVFDELMPGTNQIEKETSYETSARDLLEPPGGAITLAGLKQNIDVGVKYLAAWLEGNGCVPLYNLMEDAATAEISRTQVWQWIKYQAPMVDGTPVTRNLVRSITASIAENNPTLQQASTLFVDLCEDDLPVNFLTLPAYDLMTKGDN